MNQYFFKSSRGDVTIYISLMMALIMLASAAVLSMTLAKQIRLTKNVEHSERALYAANTGIEEAYYKISRSVVDDPADGFDINGNLDYGDDGLVGYSGRVTFVPGSGICIERMVGGGADLMSASHGEQRKLAVGCGEVASHGSSTWTGGAPDDSWNSDANWNTPPASGYDVEINDDSDGDAATPVVNVSEENDYTPPLRSIRIRSGTFNCNKKLNFKTIIVQGNGTKFVGSDECPLTAGTFVVVNGATLSASSIIGDTLSIGGP